MDNKAIFNVIVNESGIDILANKLIQVDRYTALRYIAIRKSQLTTDKDLVRYNDEGKVDELHYSKRLLSSPTLEMIGFNNLSVEKQKAFLIILNKIDNQLIIFFKSLNFTSLKSKIELFKNLRMGYQLLRLSHPFYTENTNETLNYIDETIQELESKEESSSIVENKKPNESSQEQNKSEKSKIIGYKTKHSSYSLPRLSTEIILFDPDIIEPLYEVLKKFFSIEDRPYLMELLKSEELLKSKELRKKLLFRSKASKLIDLIVRVSKKGHCSGTQTKVCTWINLNFEYLNFNNQNSEFSVKHAKNFFLPGKKTAKSTRIKLEIID